MATSSPENKELLMSENEKIGLGIFAFLQAITIALVPLIVSKKIFFPFIVPRTSFFMIMVSLLVINWAILHYLNPAQYRLPWKNPIIIGVGGLLSVWTISGLLGVDWVLSFWSTYQRMTGIMLMLYLFVWLLVSTAVLRTQKVWDRLLGLFVLTGVAVSLYTIFGPHGLGWATSLDLSRGGATIGNTSFLGAYVMFTLFTALILAVRHYQKTKKIITWRFFSVLAMVFSPALFNYNLLLGRAGIGEALQNPTMFMGQARAVAISIVLGLIVSGGLYLLRQPKTWQKITGGIMSLGVMISSMVGLVLLFRPGSRVYEAFAQLASRSRFAVWSEAINAFKERPLLGWGPESFDLVHQRFFDSRLYVESYGGELWFDRAHNIVIDTMVSTGILGVLAYAGVFAGLFYVVHKLRTLKKVSDAESALLGGLMFAYLLQNMTVFDMTVSYVAFFLILTYVAAKLPRSAFDETKQKLSAIPNQLLHVGIASLAVVLIFVWPVRILTSAWSISKSFASDSPSERMDYYQQAFELPMGRTLFLRTVSTRMYETIRARPELITPLSMDVIQSESEFFETALLYEAEVRPYNYRAYIAAAKMAQLQAYAGRPQKVADAEAYVLAAVAIAPQNPMAYISLYELAAMQGEWDKAEEYLTTMLSVAPDSAFIQRSYDAAWKTITQLRAGETPDQQEAIRF